MNSIGIRAAPKEITFAILNTENGKVVNVEELIVPVSLDRPESLKYVRNNILDILHEYSVTRAAIRINEGIADPNVERLQLEAVIQEAFASANLVKFKVFQIASLAPAINCPREQVKKMIDGTITPDFIESDDWARWDKVEREAILTAIGVSNA
jgi:hypothetical protein